MRASVIGRRSLTSLLVLLFALFGGPHLRAASAQAATASVPADPAGALLSRMRAACGGAAWDRVQGWRESGRLEAPGRPSLHYEVIRDMRTLKNVYINHLGARVLGVTGYDGVKLWRLGREAKIETTDDPAVLRKRRRHAYLGSFGYFFPDRFAATFSVRGSQTVEGRSYDVLRVTPADAEGADLWIDRETSRVARIVVEGEMAVPSDYRTFDGVCAPTKVRQTDGTAANEVTLYLETVRTGPVQATAFMARDRR